jgi:hypothetical protein
MREKIWKLERRLEDFTHELAVKDQKIEILKKVASGLGIDLEGSGV